jgi:hypothetical protein
MVSINACAVSVLIICHDAYPIEIKYFENMLNNKILKTGWDSVHTIIFHLGKSHTPFDRFLTPQYEGIYVFIMIQ